MKKIVLCLVFSLMLTAQVFADVIVMPENGFYAAHEDECEYVGQTFKAIRDTNTCTKPNGAVIGVLKKDEKAYIDCVYFDENGYGYGMYTGAVDGKLEQYWINLRDAEVAYDERVFYHQFENDIKEYDGRADDLDFTKAVRVYAFPGSDTWFEYSWSSITPSMFQMFTDENGQTWVNAAAGWINADNLYGEVTPIEREVPDDYEVLKQTPRADAPPEKNNTWSYVIAVVLVVAACVTAFAVIYKKYTHE